MKKRIILFVLVFFGFFNGAKAQFTQLELASGLKKTDFTSFSLRSLTPEAKVSIGTLAFFQKFHTEEDFQFDEAGVHSTIYWNIDKNFSFGPGLYYNSVAGFSQRVSLLYGLQSADLVFTVIPTIAWVDETETINGELFMQMQLTRPLSHGLKFLLSSQLLTNWRKFSHHSRSFIQLRAGLDKKATQFGLAIDYDWYGENPISRSSIGLFIRKIFISN